MRKQVFPVRLGLVAFACGLSSAAFAAGLPVAPPARQDPVRFADEIMPLLAANCTACHNAKLPEGGLSMESLATIQKGGDSGSAIAAGKPAESVLFLRATHREGDAMPPPDNKVGAKNLTPAQLGLLERWIAEGAKGSTAAATSIAWRPLPRGTGGVIAVAMSADGGITAAARGGRVSVFDTQSGGTLAMLVDPALSGLGPDLAHADIVSAAAFSPTEDLLATGSFRTIKLWKRADVRHRGDVAGTAGATGAAAARAGSLVAVPAADGRVAIIDTAAADPSAVRFVGLAGPPAVAVAISADGGVVAVAGRDNTVGLWQVADGAAAGRLTPPAELRSLAFAAGGKRLVTAEADGVLRVWQLPMAAGDSADVKPLREIAGGADPVVGLAELPAAAAPAAVVGGCGDGKVTIWNIETGAVVRTFAHGGAVAGVAASPDGSHVASVGTVPGVKLWKVAGGTLVTHSSGDSRIAARLARKDSDVAVLQRDAEHAKGEVAATEKAKQAAAEAVKKAADAIPVAEKKFKETETPFLAAKAATEEAEKLAAEAMMAVTAAEAAANADPADAKAKRNVEMAKAKAAELVGKANAKAAAETMPSAAFETARVDLVVAKGAAEDAAKEVKRADEALPARQADETAAKARLQAAQAERAAVDAELKASIRPFTAVAFSRDGATLFGLDAAGGTAIVTAYGGKDGMPRRVFPVAAQATAIAVGADGRVVVAGGSGPAVVHDAGERWELVRTIGGEQTAPATDDDPSGPPVDAVLALAFSPDGTTFASGSGRASRSGEIKLWKTADGGLVRTFPPVHSDTVVTLAFSRDGRRLASGGTDRFARIHVVADGSRERSLEGHNGHVLGVAWQADGRRLVTAGADNVLKVWSVAVSGQAAESGAAATEGAERTIAGATREVSGVHFIGEGDEFVAASGDTSIRLVNATTGGVVRTLSGSGGFVSSLAVGGQLVAAGSHDGRIGIWRAKELKPLLTVEPAAKE